jgi:hypothetical protein
MNVNKNYNKNRIQITYKYKLLLKEISEHKDFSEILYEINGFADETKWGVTIRQNIVCLDENDNYRKLIEHINETKLDEDFVKKNTSTKNNRNEFEDITTKNKKNKNKKNKKKNKSSLCKDKKDKIRKTLTNFHQYFNNNNFYDSSHMKSYICSCGKKCVCECNSEYCRGDCDCEFYDCSERCYLYNDHFCGCSYESSLY